MYINWIYEQTNLNIAQFDKAMETYYPEMKVFVHDPQEHLRTICDQCNYLNAIQLVNWGHYLEQNSSILDLGCGGGWLSGYLSKYDFVASIYALDSSKHYLTDIMPQVVALMGGRPEKIVAIEGLFSPLLFKNDFLDAVVASSALHHADNLEGMLKEIRRVLREDGLLFVLNEYPSSRFGYIYSITKAITKILANLLLCNYKPISQSVSSSGYLNDPHLGDRSYPLWYWKESLKRTGFTIIEYIDTCLPTVKNGKGPSLNHIICKAI